MDQGAKHIPEQVSEHLVNYFQEGWQGLFGQGVQMQQEVLLDILALCRSSAYAQDHGFDQIGTLEEFQAQVPISEYVDYLPYIEANMQEDRQQLIGGETAYYLSTTGSSVSKIKYFAESQLGALARQLVIDIWNMALSQTVPQVRDPAVRMLAVVNCSSVDQAQNGKQVIRASGQAGKVLWERAGELYVFPYAFLEAEMSDADRDYLTALYAVKDAGFTMLYCNNMAYFGDLLDCIEQRPQQMIDDIRTGYMTATLRSEDREILRPSFIANPQRAEELQRLLDQYGYLPVEQIWPKFIFAGTWLPGSAGRMAKDIKRRLPDTVRSVSIGYGSSEAMINIPMAFDCPYGVAAPFAYFYEFLPLQGGKPLTMAEVQDGEYYELIITTYSGLYRYNLHDIVRIQGFTGTTANLEFCCKRTEVCQLPDQTVYAYQLAELVQAAEESTDCLLRFYQGFTEGQKLALAIQTFESDFAVQPFYMALQEAAAAKGIQLGNLYLMKKGYLDDLFQQQMTGGRTKQNIKLLTVIAEPPAQKWIAQVYPDLSIHANHVAFHTIQS